ncbi:MAG: hypothetical protein ACRERV_08450, partial [Methylococcales bacterium]
MKIRFVTVTGLLLLTTGYDNLLAVDTVIGPNLIVQGKECIGVPGVATGCVSGQAIGDEEILLRDQVLRIKFDDTSTAPGFPNIDWQLMLNDSGSGGINKLSFENLTASKVPFTILAGAPSSSFFIDNLGQVGFGTPLPQVELHIKSADQPAVLLEQDASIRSAQIWKMAGDESNFFIGEGNESPSTPFVIKPGATNNSLTIAANTNVGINTAAPKSNFHVFAAADKDVFIGMGVDPSFP